MIKGAEISDCGQYRYGLWRVWDRQTASVVFIMLNPSTADGDVDDPTIRRCMKYAERWGYGGIMVVNLFAYRAAERAGMRAAVDPIGNSNDGFIQSVILNYSGPFVCAWGNDGIYKRRSEIVLKMLCDCNVVPQCLKINKATGQPGHPLYLKGDLEPTPWASSL